MPLSGIWSIFLMMLTTFASIAAILPSSVRAVLSKVALGEADAALAA